MLSIKREMCFLPYTYWEKILKLSVLLLELALQVFLLSQLKENKSFPQSQYLYDVQPSGKETLHAKDF